MALVRNIAEPGPRIAFHDRELRVGDLRSPRELAQIAYDVGVQLGAGSLKDVPGDQRNSERRRALTSLARTERVIRNKTAQLVAELMAGWSEFTR